MARIAATAPVSGASIGRSSGSLSTSIFPLKVAASGRYLETQQGTPFRVQCESAWLMSLYGTPSIVDSYLDDRKAKGINAFILMLMATSDFGGPNNANGDAPLATAGHFSSTPGSAYWSWIDTIIDKAASRGMLVLPTPAYLGYQGGTQGWANDIVQSYNADPVMHDWGVWLATRWASKPNILWYLYGDYAPADGSTLSARVQAIRTGIRSVLPNALFAAEMDSPDTMPGDFTDASNMDCATYYGYGPSGRPAQTYDTANRAWGYGKPAWICEPAYEDTAFGSDVSREGIRAALWWGITAGGFAGSNFGTSGIWDFGKTGSPSVASRLDTDVCHDNVHSINFWKALPNNGWTLLVPSGKTQISSRTLIGGQTANNWEWIQGCMASDGTWLVAYVPPNGTGAVTFTIDLRGMIGTGTMRARWFNPTDGSYTAIGGTWNNTLSAKSVTTPGNNGTGQGDWVLVVDIT
jgi:hypothetical protein